MTMAVPGASASAWLSHAAGGCKSEGKKRNGLSFWTSSVLILLTISEYKPRWQQEYKHYTVNDI